MTTKERLMQELESAPEEFLQEVLSFVLTTKENADLLKTSAISKTTEPAEAAPYKPIWEIAQDITRDMTEEEIAQLPRDGAEQHDHYIYGTPKRPT